jgi:hypothetical protein
MGELIALFAAVVVIAAVGAGVAYQLNARRDDVALAHTPVVAIGNGQPSDALAKAATYYRIAQRAMRQADALLRRDEMVPFLTDAERAELRRLLNEFYGET